MDKEQLYALMQALVDKYVQSYKSDFDIDRQSIDEWDGNWWAVWIVRDHGTQLKRFTNAIEPMMYIDAVFNSMRVEKLYIISHRHGEYSIQESNYDDVKERYKYMREYHIEIYCTPYHTFLMKEVDGTFDSDEEAEKSAKWLMEKLGGQSYFYEREEESF